MKLQFDRFSGIDVPKEIGFSEKGDTLILEMNDTGISSNMQENPAAFEAWALLAKAKGYAKVELTANCNKSDPAYNRFLYRVLRFDDGFEWFTVADDLKSKVAEFKTGILESGSLFANVPEGEASDNPSTSESGAEKYFAENTEETNKLLDINADAFYRQLPVGLFQNSVSKGNEVFPRGAAAIDLWGIEGNILHVIELKVGDNIKLGVLSELFFYVCYMHDVYCRGLKVDKKESAFRGYPKLTGADIELIKGHILTEKKHPHLDAAFEELKKYRNQKIQFENAVFATQ
jgi:hypothetical protein